MITLPKIYSQNDPSWQQSNLGTSDISLGNAGCYVTTFANLATFYGHVTNVIQMNQLLDNAGQFFDGSEIASDSSLSVLYPDLEYQTTTNDSNLLNTYLDANEPVILKLNAPSLAGTHFALAIGYQDGQLMIADSWDGTVKPVTAYGDILNMIFYKIKNNNDMTTLTTDDYNTLVNLGFKDNADVLISRGITSGDYTDRIKELADSISRPKFYDAVNSQAFDLETKAHLSGAISNKDATYIIAFAGSEPRKGLFTVNQNLTDTQALLDNSNSALAAARKQSADLQTEKENLDSQITTLNNNINTLQTIPIMTTPLSTLPPAVLIIPTEKFSFQKVLIGLSKFGVTDALIGIVTTLISAWTIKNLTPDIASQVNLILVPTMLLYFGIPVAGKNIRATNGQ